MTLRSILLLVAVASALPVGAVDLVGEPANVRALFARGERLLETNQVDEARLVFDSLVTFHADSPNRDLWLTNRGRAELRATRFSEAIASFSLALSTTSSSRLRSELHFHRGNARYAMGYARAAMSDFVVSWRDSRRRELTELALDAVVAVLDSLPRVALPIGPLLGLSQQQRCTLVEVVGDRLVQRGQGDIAMGLAVGCSKPLSLPLSRFPDSVRLAVFLPFSGPLADFGDQLWRGVLLAVELYEAETGRSLDVALFDTQADPVTAARIAKEISDRDFDAAIGPLTSDAAIAVAGVLTDRPETPFLLPAASEGGLTALGPSVFQLVPNLELQAAAMATHAVSVLGCDSAVVLTATEPLLIRQAEAFAARFRSLGGTVVMQRYYRSRDRDFGPYLQDIKATLNGWVSVDDGVYLNAVGDTLDAQTIPATVDCLYLPGAGAQLRLLLPQIEFYNISGWRLGNDAFGDDAILNLADNVTSRVIFPSALSANEVGGAYGRLATMYGIRYDGPVSRLTGLGYDAVSLLAAVLNEGVDNSAELVIRLNSVAGFEGTHGTISFNAMRENREIPLYKIANKQQERIGLSGLTPSRETPPSVSEEN